MSSHATPRVLTPDEYLEFERSSEVRHEFVDGQLIEMTGASPRHGRIVVNLIVALHGQLRGKACDVLGTAMRLKVSRRRHYVYPDVLVVCGRAEIEDEFNDSILNPTLIIEVLSPSTQDYDHGRKWLLYQQLSTLQDYLLVAQEQVQVERYSRQQDGSWLYRVVDDPQAALRLDSIGCTLRLAEVYENEFDTLPERQVGDETDHG